MVEKMTQQKCLKRFFKHLFYIPIADRKLRSQWLAKPAKTKLSALVTAAEQGHRGEICVIIENSLPLASAYQYGARARAIELFSRESVWDSEENTGVLIYINVCERSLDIVADRGINACVQPDVWQRLCDSATDAIKGGRAFAGIAELINAVGNLLNDYHTLHHDPSGNEISDAIRHLH
ncbi:MAG: hypothetical protein CR975_07140 [Gammaproteobacteria bacterium]|nr:MAG: hypothetical protein CR975_07140 [Gammaproteobacteria bacterium]